jgi:putative membrane-bound dehydrogenase-like protein
MAFEDKKEGLAILITVDNLGVSDEITQEIAGALAKKLGVKRERLTLSATHTHTAPMLKSVSPTIFGTPIPPEHQANIDRYTRDFISKVEEVAAAAVRDIRPSLVSWGTGKAKFAVNRRTKGGPVDHDLPVLVVSDPDGKVRGLYFSYACHCVTLSNNKISGDWAGFAQDAVQKEFPGAIALASVGCGADSNPSSGVTGDKLQVCEEQGNQIADEIKRIVALGLKPVTARPTILYARIDLPFDAPRTRAEWEERAKSADYAIAYHANLNLKRLDRGEELPKTMTYPIQTWLFGDQLAIVFLPGETVVDYALRLKSEFDRNRLWVNGYANESRCYIPSERVLKEGGYEGGGAMVYYDRPQRFAPGLEQKVIDTVTRQLPQSYVTTKGTEGIHSLSPADSLRSLHTRPGLKIELVAAEPLIQSPVAIDWGADGKLWVCEMFDYPAGPDGDYQPGGRVRLLANHDGRYDKATTFLEGLPFPTGITAWGKGVLVCAAPDILYAEDTNGDGKADKIERLYSGFATENYQARVNTLSLGLDNWIYGANGLISRAVTNDSIRVDIRNRDFRFRPLNKVFEAVSGCTQQGRVRDDWGRWFGCANSDAVWYYPYEERYILRNPHVPAPPPTVWPAGDYDVSRVFPRSQLLERFNDPDAANRMTSGCGLCVYRDTLLGESFYGNTFTCEPVHNLVTRLVLGQKAGQLTRNRADGEQNAEFLASTDNWFRPVQARCGPDGALYVVDMYRFVIEHPRWIPAARLAKLDARAGATMGRIYRVLPADGRLRSVEDLTRLKTRKLAQGLDSPNGTERDRVHIELLNRKDQAAKPVLENIALKGTLPQVRLQALCVLEGIHALDPGLLRKAFNDPDSHVRQQAVRLCEPFFNEGNQQGAQPLFATLLGLSNDSSPLVLQQLAFSLGEWDDPRAKQTLAHMATAHLADRSLRIAVLSSVNPQCGPVLDAIMSVDERTPGREDWIPRLVATAAASANDALFAQALAIVLPPNEPKPPASRLSSLANLLEALEDKKTSFSEYLSSHPKLSGLEPNLLATFEAARNAVADNSTPENYREAAIRLLARGNFSASDLELLCKPVFEPSSDKIRSAALTALRRQRSKEVAAHLLAHWQQISPAVRSEVVALLITRDEWARSLLEAVNQGSVRSGEISLEQRQYLTRKAGPATRQLAAKTFISPDSGGRAEVLQKYQAALSLSGTSTNGAEVFSKNCATCHSLDGIGHDVGPNLTALRNKDADYWIKNILDPNAAVEPRFIGYEIDLKDGRTLSGIIQEETATSLNVVAGGGVTETLKRGEIGSIRASSLSLMPEGLEQGITVQDMADLVSFLRNAGPAKPVQVASAESLARDPASMTSIILDTNLPNSVREALIGANPQFAVDFISEMTRSLVPGSQEEYARIPWLWRVAFAAGKRNDPDQIKRMLLISMPGPNEPLFDWQAVVIGGGIINGLSLRGHWPAERLAQIFGEDPSWTNRWDRTLELAALMADNEKVPSGTRYDAMRILGAGPWEKWSAQLEKYLAKGVNAELQQGAISALSDMQSPKVAAALVAGLSHYSKSNLDLTIEALMRDDKRIETLLDEVAAGRITRADLTEKRVERLKNLKTEALAHRARAVVLK